MKLGALTLGSLVLAAALPAVAADLRATDEAAIKDLVARYSAAREERDPKAIEALFTKDADQLVSSGVWRRGRPALVKGMLESSRRNSGRRTITVETVRPLSADSAVADARYIIAGTDGTEDRKMWSTFLTVKMADGWRIAAIRNMRPAQ